MALGPGNGDKGVERDQHRAAVHGRHAGNKIAAQGSQITGLYGADGPCRLLHSRRVLRHQVGFHDFRMGDGAADAQPLIGQFNAFEF